MSKSIEQQKAEVFKIYPEIEELFSMQEQQIQQLQVEYESEWAKKQKAEAEQQHRKQCRILALEHTIRLSISGLCETRLDPVIKDADKVYEWLVKIP